MRRVGPTEDAGPMFYLVHEIPWHAGSVEPIGISTWDSRAYWSVEAANKRAAEFKKWGFKAFVEAR